MVLISTININLVDELAILNCTSGGDIVENITYDNSTHEITFDERGYKLINFSEFLSFCDQLNIFQTAIIFNYPQNGTNTTPFTQMIANEFHDSGTWSLVVTPNTDPNVCDYVGTKSSLKMEFNKRSGNQTLTYPEWLYFLIMLNHYSASIRYF